MLGAFGASILSSPTALDDKYHADNLMDDDLECRSLPCRCIPCNSYCVPRFVC